MRRQRTIVFCEVKTRTTDAFGTPAEAVTRAKRQQAAPPGGQVARRVARSAPVEIRFDVAAILAGELEMIEGAF